MLRQNRFHHGLLEVGTVRLEARTTKSGQARTIYLTDDLRVILEGQLASIEALKREGTICPDVFHYPGGSPIRDCFRRLWRKACAKAGYPGKLLHDFRRTAVRNFERAGVPRSTAMQMVGHQTESIYRRYAIVDDAMHREAVAKLNRFNARKQLVGQQEGGMRGARQVKQFSRRVH